MTWLSGYKTYIVVFAGLAAVFASFVSGDMSVADAVTRALELLGLAALRSGVANA